MEGFPKNYMKLIKKGFNFFQSSRTQRRYQYLLETLSKMKDTQTFNMHLADQIIPHRWRHNSIQIENFGKRHDHQVVKWGSRIYLFGGSNEQSVSGKSNSDFFVYDLITKSIMMLESDVKPKERCCFGMAVEPQTGNILVGGGINDEGACSDLWRYDVRGDKWSLIFKFDATETMLCVLGHSMCAFNSGVFFFGGSSGMDMYSNSLAYLDLATLQFNKINTRGEQPGPRFRHQTVIIENRMLVFGGGNPFPCHGNLEVYALNLITTRWTKLQTHGNDPQSRAAHSCTVDDTSGLIFLFGGYTHCQEYSNTLYSFDAETYEWSFIFHLGKEAPVPCSFHSATAHCGALYIFGGLSTNNTHCDSWVFDIVLQPQKLVVLASKALLNFDTAAAKKHLPSEVKSGLQKMSQFSKQTTEYSYWTGVS